MHISTHTTYVEENDPETGHYNIIELSDATKVTATETWEKMKESAIKLDIEKKDWHKGVEIE